MIRHRTKGRQTSWKHEEIRAGFFRFFELNGRWPSSHEIDACEFLPSTKTLQRTFGGVPKMRAALDLPPELIDLRKGETRSQVAGKLFAQSAVYEERIHALLSSVFGEVRVHEQKILRPGNIRSDFFIYLTPTDGVAVDLFWASSVKNVSGVVNLKLARYAGYPGVVYFVVVNDSLSQDELNQMAAKRKGALPDNRILMTEKVFEEFVRAVPGADNRLTF